MEANGLGGGLFSAMSSAMLGLEMPLQQQQNPQNPQNQHHLHHPQVISYAHHEPDHHLQAQQSVKHGYPYTSKSKQVSLSDEEEPGFGADDSASVDGKRKASMSPWQRMKWTDTMVKLLIMAVYYIGDEGGSDGIDPTGKKKPSGGLLQKKGKWKSVSRAMMEKGFYVSPQQCEDKFNDLNKRYKRVNDLLGKGTACKVVENQSLLDSMDLTPKVKEEVRKLLNSKHLFFREMCAYHNSCSHGNTNGVGAAGTSHQPHEEPSQVQPQQQNQQKTCHHSPVNARVGSHLGIAETEGSKMVKAGSGGEDEEEDDEDDDSEDSYDEDEDEEGSHEQIGHGHEDEDNNNYERASKRARKGVLSESTQIDQKLSIELNGVIQDMGKSSTEKKQYLKTRLLQLEEQQVSFQYRAFQLEKQRLKWFKFSSKKEREMEKAKFENERRRLENERMVLLIRRKEMELYDLHHPQQSSSNKRGCDPSPITG
ncbi:hypothetical protein UlMin_005649 [Ulmus minor]